MVLPMSLSNATRHKFDPYQKKTNRSCSTALSYQNVRSSGVVGSSVLDGQRFNIPDAFCILLDTPVAREETHASHTGDALLDPRILVFESFVDQLVRLEVAVEIVGDKVIIAMVDDGVDQGGESSLIAELAGLDRVKDLAESGIEFLSPVEVIMTKVFDVFGEVAEEEDVLLAGFAGDFNLNVKLD